MRDAEFEENVFAGCANSVLAVSRNRVFTPGQVLEGRIGFDVAFGMPSPLVFPLMGVAQVAGIRLVPGLFAELGEGPAERFPSYLVSLFLQYKRPSYCDGATDRHFAHWGGPYYQFAVRRGQHGILRRLEDSTGDQAVVRYAAPAFWQIADLWRHDEEGTLLQQTAFAAPRAIGDHEVWSYREPGRQGLANPDPEATSADDWPSLGRLLSQKAARMSLAEHCRFIRERTDAVVDSIADYGSLRARLSRLGYSQRARYLYEDVIRVLRNAASLQTTWFIIALDGPNESIDPNLEMGPVDWIDESEVPE